MNHPRTKAQIVERVLRTLKGKMWKYFTHAQTHKYIDVLDQLVQSYNRTYHRSIGMAPAEVNHQNAEDVWRRLYEDSPAGRRKFERPRYVVGDLVRISKARRTFKKGYEGNWSRELFRVTEVKRSQPPTYAIGDLRGEPVLGSFYHEELQRVGEMPELYAVESVLDERRLGGKAAEVLVKWLGYPAQFNTWIPKRELRDYKA